MKKSPYLWIVTYINAEYMGRINKDIRKIESFKGIKASVPTVKVVAKKFKNKVKYNYIPLLFNYGFVRIPKKIYSEELLKELKDKVPAIVGFLKTQIKEKHKAPVRDLENKTIKIDHHIPYALVTKGKVEKLEEKAKTMSIYNKGDLKSLKEGVIITLKGYPFEGLMAKVQSVDFKRKKLTVDIFSDEMFNKVVVIEFENALYSVYQDGYDDSLSNHKSLDEVRANRNSNDKMMYANENS